MATSLQNETPAAAYGQLLHVDGGVTASPKTVYGGDGTATGLQISTTGITVGDVSEAEIQYLNGVTSGIQAQIDAKQATLSKLALTAFTPSNLVWTGTTAPSSTTNHEHSFVNAGGFVTGFIRLDWVTAGSALTQVAFDFPSDWPAPAGGGSLAANNRYLSDYGLLNTSLTANGTAGRAFLARNAANNGWSIIVAATSGNYRTAIATIRYWAA